MIGRGTGKESRQLKTDLEGNNQRCLKMWILNR